MRRVVHISDLHFGRTDNMLVSALSKKVQQLDPAVVVVSGDITQRARKEQFRQAQNFLEGLPHARVVVPGNHDLPIDNLFSRFFRPLSDFRKYISHDLFPKYHDDELAILGLNTARPFNRVNGSIDDSQVQHAQRFFDGFRPEIVKILVTHHLFAAPEVHAGKYLLRGARHAIAALATCRTDLYLAGHAHASFADFTAKRYKVAHHTALIVQAGTGVSTRTRAEPNSFILLHIDRPSIAVEVFQWNARVHEFRSVKRSDFRQTESGWTMVLNDEAPPA